LDKNPDAGEKHNASKSTPTHRRGKEKESPHVKTKTPWGTPATATEAREIEGGQRPNPKNTQKKKTNKVAERTVLEETKKKKLCGVWGRGERGEV